MDDIKRETKKIITLKEALTINDLSDYYICFYEQDGDFERIRKNPKKYVNLFTKRAAGIIGFDFSIHSDMPLIKQKSQINDNLSFSYFYAKNGAKIIPNIRYGNDDTVEDFMNAIPKNELVAIGTHGFMKTNVEKAEWFDCISKIVTYLNPTGIIVFGTLPDSIILEHFKNINFYFYEPYIDKRIKEVNKNGN